MQKIQHLLIQLRYVFLSNPQRWSFSQKLYQKWSKQPLPNAYLKEVCESGKRFSNFVTYPLGLCLNVGCGNGLFNGETYEESGYCYLLPDRYDFVIGVDPLPLVAPLPKWLNRYVQERFENFQISRPVQSIVFATSLEHFSDPLVALRKAHRLLDKNGSLWLWVTEFHDSETVDPYHPTRFLVGDIGRLLTHAGFMIYAIERRVMPTHVELFIEGTKPLGVKANAY